MTTPQSQSDIISPEEIAVIIPAAGSGSRMKGDQPKQFRKLNKTPLLIHTIAPFLLEKKITEVIVVCPPDGLEKTKQLCRDAFPTETRLRYVCGGKRRQDSVYNGIKKAKARLLMIHDGARPLITRNIICCCCQALAEKKAFVTAIPVVDTIKQFHNDMVEATVDRSSLFRAQTPQGGPKILLEQAYSKLKDEEVTDEASLLEKAGITVYLVPGEERNFKITREEDLALAETLLAKQQNGGVRQDRFQPAAPRVGHGFDAHRLVTNRKLVLGGVDIAFSKGLDGHSDADVVAHALCDALLGAVGAGDIGKFYPDTDQQFKDISSLLLLADVAEKIDKMGFRLENADITLVCQAPKIAPYIEQMKQNICKTWQHRHNWPQPAAINIKATTEEKMGYTGRGEGISCHAVVLLTPCHNTEP